MMTGRKDNSPSGDAAAGDQGPFAQRGRQWDFVVLLVSLLLLHWGRERSDWVMQALGMLGVLAGAVALVRHAIRRLS